MQRELRTQPPVIAATTAGMLARFHTTRIPEPNILVIFGDDDGLRVAMRQGDQEHVHAEQRLAGALATLLDPD